MKAVSSALTWAAIVLITLSALPVIAVLRVLDRSPARLRAGRALRIFGSAFTRINSAWHLRITGVDPATLRHPYVVVSNHLSAADIPLISRLPWEMKWVAKKALFDVPVLGWMLHMVGDIPVDRKDPRSRATVLRRARSRITNGASVMFFPEGTRSRDGRLKTFHDGAFRLAIAAGVPVLPLAIDGTSDALPTSGWQFSDANIRLAVLPPVPTDGLTADDVAALRDRVRGIIRAQVAEWRGLPEAAVDGLPRPSGALAEAPPGPGEERAKSGPAAPSQPTNG